MRATFQNLFASLNVAVFLRTRREHAISLVRWTLILIPMAVAVGTLCAAFLWSLDWATRARFDYPWLLFMLPFGGAAIGLLYHWTGKSVEGGNNLIVEQIHEPGGGVPLRMAPLIFIGTVATHLFGGSAGREGTAVQLGGSLANAVAKVARLDEGGVRIILMAGIAAGFGAVFGTPLAGAVFALEVLAVGRVEYAALMPCLVAGIVGDWACHMWGIHHGAYHITYLTGGSDPAAIDPALLLKAAVAGVVFGLAGLCFAEANHTLGGWSKRLIPYGPARPFVGGLVVIVLVYLFGTRAYLGLGVWSADPSAPTIAGFFNGPVDHWSWALKMLFTVITLSSGFKGGEVTPLFYIGAALGNALGGAMGAPVDLFAGLGFLAVFAGAANTPLACTVMGLELFGATHMLPIAVACFVAYICSGHSGIYLSQRIAIPKVSGAALLPDITLRDIRAARGQPTFVNSDVLCIGDFDDMPNQHAIVPNEVGMIRIYVKPSDKAPTVGKSWLGGRKSLYRAIVAQAKAAGIMHAVAHNAQFGFVGHGPIRANGSEAGNPQLTMYVEVIGLREQLEAFCRDNGDLLREKPIIYKHLEHWTITAAEILHEDASDEELRAEP